MSNGLFCKQNINRKLAWVLALSLILGLVPFPAGFLGSLGNVLAVDDTHPFYFSDGRPASENLDVGTEGGTYKLTVSAQEITLYKSDGAVASGTSIEFDTASLDSTNPVAYVVRKKDGSGNELQSVFDLIRKGPGFTTIAGKVVLPEGDYYPFSFKVMVELDIERKDKYDSTKIVGYAQKWTTDKEDDYSLWFGYPGMKYQIHITGIRCYGTAVRPERRLYRRDRCCFESRRSGKGKQFCRGIFQSKFNCPCCDSNKVVMKGVNDVLTLVPALKEEYDFDAHDIFDIFTEGVFKDDE